MNDFETAPPAIDPANALTLSLKGEHLTDSLGGAIDAGADATISALHGVPFLGIAVGIGRVAVDITKELRFRKVVRFLLCVATTTLQERQAFTDKLEREGKAAEFGENILLLLERLDDVSKPAMVGKVMAAHIRGDITYDKAMRLSAIISRCYAADLNFLKTFQPGTQGGNEAVADMLFSAGLLGNGGIDGGNFSDPESGGTIYVLNEYATLLLTHAL